MCHIPMASNALVPCITTRKIHSSALQSLGVHSVFCILLSNPLSARLSYPNLLPGLRVSCHSHLWSPSNSEVTSIAHHLQGRMPHWFTEGHAEDFSSIPQPISQANTALHLPVLTVVAQQAEESQSGTQQCGEWWWLIYSPVKWTVSSD